MRLTFKSDCCQSNIVMSHDGDESKNSTGVAITITGKKKRKHILKTSFPVHGSGIYKFRLLLRPETVMTHSSDERNMYRDCERGPEK